MTKQTQGKLWCDGGGQPGLDDVPPGKGSRCSVCTARPKTDNHGNVKRHERCAPRTMVGKNPG